LWQIVACLTLAIFGLQIRGISVFHLDISLGLLTVPMTLVWLLGTINAINLLDGADGLASSVGILLCLTVALLAMYLGHPADGFLALAIAGALLGFLRYNFAPASIYLGDTGSMFIGLAVGAIAIHARIKGTTSLALAVPLCMMAIPAFDSIAALARRKLTGCSLFAPDHGHIHHILLRRGCSVPQTVFIIVGVCFLTCVGAALSLFLRRDLIAIGTLLFVIGMLIACRIFGYVEFGLIFRRLATTMRCRLHRVAEQSAGAVQDSYHLYGSRNWDNLWAGLSESAETYGLIHLEFRVVMPAISESFYAVWSKPSRSADDECWSVKSPLSCEGRTVGYLLLVGHSRESAIQTISAVTDFLEPVEQHIAHAVAELRNRGKTAVSAPAEVQSPQLPVATAVAAGPTSAPAQRNNNRRVRRQPVHSQ
jgi:UDP-GlcNAc:undecaprenyl-phosphate/decaprenyl-phosphate GlcNAc-1-phosphate transferase